MSFIPIMASFLEALILLASCGVVAPRYDLVDYQPQGGTPPPGGSTTSAMQVTAQAEGRYEQLQRM
ncbi:MAG: hypothetical protein ACFB0G_07635 [Leptolyngbyaceae cyanobacterium]